MRLIDADALYESIMLAEMGKVNKFCFPCKEIQQAIDEQPTIEERKTGWIPCNERLPEEDEEVLVTSNSGIFIAAWSEKCDNEIYWYEAVEGKSLHEVTAWMPLPKPYGGRA